MDRSAAAREWRQFRLLCRDGIRRLLAAAVLSREADPTQFAIWIVAAVAVPPSMFAFSQMVRYEAARAGPPLALERLVLEHRMFFVVYAMLAAALLAALLWETLLPDRTDQEVVGALPVRPRTYAAARLAAATYLGVLFAAAVCLPSALLFAASASGHPVLGSLPRVFAGQAAATMSGALWVFGALLIARAIVAALFGARASERLALALQIVVIAAFVETFLYLPVVLSWLVAAMLRENGTMLPPVWFAGLYAWIAGAERNALGAHALRAGAALALAIALVVPAYVWPARLLARRALESRGDARAGRAASVTRATARLVARRPQVRTLYAFAITSVLRSRPHLLLVATYVGLGLAVALVRVLAGLGDPALWTAPGRVALSIPLSLMFVLVIGLRSAFVIPTDLAANWPFRSMPPAPPAARAATRRALLALGVVPVVAAAGLAAALLGWPVQAVASLVLLDLAAGVFLVECALVGWIRIPCACEHAPAQDTVKVKWLLFLATMLIFVFEGAATQQAVIWSPARTAVLAGALLLFAAAIELTGRRRAAAQAVPFDEAAGEDVTTLNLSEALR